MFAITFDVVRWPHVTWVGMLFGLILRRLPFGRVHSVELRPTSDGSGSASCTLVWMELGYCSKPSSSPLVWPLGHSTDLSRMEILSSPVWLHLKVFFSTDIAVLEASDVHGDVLVRA